MNFIIQKEKRLLTLVIVVLTLLTVGLTFFEYTSYQHDKQLREAEVREQLITINNLKMSELTGWREGNLESAEVLNHSADFSEHVEFYLENPDDLHNRSQVRSWLQVYRLHNEYESIQLLDTDGKILISDTDKPAPISEKVTSRIPDLLIKGQVELMDFYFDEIHQQSRLAILIPILSSKNSKQAIGLVAVIIDPNIRIFPNLQEWPASSESGESFLVRLEAQEVSVLSPSAPNNNEQFAPRYQLTDSSIPPLHMKTDLSHTMEGVNYRGTPVVAAVNAIPDSPWVLVSQIDKDEAFAPLREHLSQAFIQWISIFALFSAILAMVWRSQRMRFYRQQLEMLDELKQSRERYQNFISHSFEAISRTELDNPIDITLPTEAQIDLIYENAYLGECNQAMADMYNVTTPEEFIGMRLIDAHKGRENPQNRAAFKKFIEGGYKSINDETLEYTADGQPRWFLSNTVGIIENGHLIRLWGTAIDITDRKQTEEALNTSRQLLQTIVNNVPVRVFWKDRESRYLGCNPSFAMDAGETDLQNIIGKDDYELSWRNQADFYRADDQKVMSTGVGKFFYEEPQSTPDGKLIMISTSKVPLRDEYGQTIGVLGIYQDITEQKQAEELILAQRDLAYIISSAASSKDALSRSLAIALRISGYDSGGIYLFNDRKQTLDLAYHHGLGENFVQSSLSYPAEAPNVKMLLTGASFYFNDEELKDREIFLTEGIHSYASLPIQHYGKTIGCINVASHAMLEVPAFTRRALEVIASEIGNIVTYLQTETSLHESEEKYRSLINSQESSIAMLDAEGVYHYVNEIGAARLNGSVQDIIGKKAQDLLPPETVEWKINVLQQVIETGQGIVQEVQLQEASGKFWHRISVQPIRDANGQIKLAMLTSIDITERKKAEAELQDLKDRLLEAQQLTHVGNWEWDTHKQVLFWSEEVYRIFGVNPAEFLPTVEAFESAIHPEDKESFLAQRAKMLEEQQAASIDHRIILPDGRVRHVTEKTQLIKDKSGNITRVIGTVQDVTEQKLAQEALLKSQALLAEAQKIGHIGHWEWTSPDNKLICSDEIYNIFDMQKGGESISQQAILNLMPPEEVERLRKLEHTVFSTHSDSDYEYRINLSGSRKRWIHQKAKIIYSKDGQPIRMMGTIQDITEYKQAQEDLQSAHEFLQGVQDALSAHLAILDENGVILQVNSAWRKFGKENGLDRPDACIGMNYLQVCDSAEGADASEAKQVAQEIRAVCSGEKTAAWVEYLCHGLEEKRWYVVHITKFMDRGQVRIVLAHENITERKMADEALRASEERYRLITSYVDEIVWQVNTDLRFVYASPAATRVLGYTNEEAVNLHIYDLMNEEDAARMHGNIMARINHEPGVSNKPTEYRMRHKNGNWIETEALATPIFDKANRLIGFAGITRDITERKVIERQLQEAERKYRALVEYSPVVVYVDEIGGEWQYISPQIKKILGYSPTDFLSDAQAFKKLIHPDDLHRFKVEVNESLKKGQSLKLEYRMLTRDGSYVWIHDESDLTQSGDNGKYYLQGVFYDITERKQAEEALAYNERRFRALIENIADGIQLVDMKGEVIYVSPSAARLLGYQQGELEAPITSLIHPDDLNQVAASISKSMTTQDALMQSYRVKHKDGTWRWFEGSITNRLADPAIGSIVMTFRDVTERKRSEDALRESEENFHSLFEDSPIAIWLEDFSQLKNYLDRLREQGITNIKNYLNEHPAELERLSDMVKILEINKTSARILGAQTKAEVLKSLPDYFTKESLKVFADEIAALADGQTQFKGEIPIKDLYGKEVIFDLTLTVQPGSEEDLSRVLVSFLDVTEQKLSNAKLKESEERFRQLADNIHEVFWMFDRESQKHIYANPAYRSIFGIMEEDILLKHLIEIVLPEDRPILEAAIEKQINGEPTEAEYRIKWPDDSIHWIWDRSFPVYDEEGKLTRTAGIATDITLNKKAEEELKERESFLQSIVGGSPGYIVSHDIEGHFLYANRRWPEQSEEEFRSMKLQNMLHPDSLEPVMEAFRKAFVTRETQRIEQSVLTPSGDYHWFDVIYSPQVVNDEVKSVTAFAYDINDRKLAEIALRENEEKYRGLMESLDSIVATLDYDGRFSYLNDKAAEALGRTVHDIIGRTMYEVFPKETAIPIMEKVQAAINDDKGILMENMNLVRGELRWYRTMIQPIHDEHGKVLYVLTNSTDIHDLKMAQHDLQELNNTLEERVQIRTAEVQDLYDNAPNGYHSLDADGALVMINQTELNWLGYTRHEVLGKMKFRDLLGSENSSMFDGIFSQFVTSGKIADQTLRLIRKDGSPLPVLLNAYAIYDEYGNFTTSRCTITDITERVKIENALRESRDQLSAANVSLEKAARLKDEFLASMSHELRTPLTGVLGLSEALQLNAYGELNEKQLRTIKAIEESGRHLLELINDILDLSKIEAGKLDMQFTSFSINDICHASLQLIKGMANQKRQNVHFTPPAKPIMLNADPRRIKQILVNLLSNAVKFTPEHGELGLVIEVNPADENISMAVWDKGIGIKTENIQKLFKPFTQIDSSLAREYSGTGLGLSLAHRLVELHGGRIELESVFGEGSRFTVILPWSDEEALSVYGELDAPSQSQSNKTGETNPSMIMVADDNETVLEMITDFLESKQYRVTKARSGAELIQKVPEILPDLILVDIQMPGMDGLETIRLIRSSSNPTIASVPIIAVTALAMPGDRERCLRAGATDYMSKPMKLNELAMLIQKRKRPQ